MKKSDCRIDITISVVMATLSAIVYFQMVKFFLPTPYLLNDQVIFREILSGNYTGSPSGETIFIMIILGQILATLYKIFPGVQWYDLLACALFPLGAFLFSLFFSLQAKRKIFKILWPIVLTLVYYLCTTMIYVQNEFTVNASIFAAVGLLYFSANLYNGKKGFYNFVAVTASIIAVLLRVNVFVLTIPFLVIIFAKSILDEKSRKGCLKCTLFLILAITISLAVEKTTHSSPEWQEFQIYNVARANIFDYEGLYDEEETIKELETYGISYVEYKGLQEEFGLVKSIDAEELAKIYEITGSSLAERLVKTDYTFVISLFLKDLTEYLRQPIGFIGFSVFAIIVLIEITCSKEKGWRRFDNLILGSLGLGYTLVFSFYFVFIGRFPDRVYVSLGFVMTAFYLALLIDELGSVKEEKKLLCNMIQGVYIIALLCLFGILFQGKTKYATGNWYWKMENMEISDELCNLCDSNPDNLYYISRELGINLESFLGDEDYCLPANYMTETYWTHNSPVHFERLKRLGITNTIDAIMEMDNFYYVAYANNDLSWLCDLTKLYGHEISLRLDSTLESRNGIINIYYIEN